MKNTHLKRLLEKLDELHPSNISLVFQKLLKKRQLLEAVFNLVKEGILVILDSGLIEYANQAASIMLNLPETAEGTLFIEKYLPELQSLSPSDTLPLDSDVLTNEIELSYPQHRFVRIYMVPFPENKEGPEKRFAVILTDITKEKISVEEQFENEHLSSLFLLASGVAHDLGNPLNSINIHLQLIKRQLNQLKNSKPLETAKNSVEVCINEVSRLDGIITNFLKAIRHSTPEFQEVNCLTLIQEVIELQAQEMEDLGILIEINSTEPPPPTILGDPIQLKQAFFNVIRNAIEAMDQGGHLSISFSRNDQYSIIQFSDSGVGINQMEINKVFEPHQTTKKSGHGLGMMIVQNILRNHKGKIALESKKGQGSKVTLYLPLKNPTIRMLKSTSN